MAEFYSEKAQVLFDDVLWLPQKGATTDRGGRPPNAYAILERNGAILVDAAYSWTMPGVRRIADAGLPPLAFILTHAHVADEGDAFEEIRNTYDCAVMMHPAAARLPQVSRAGVAFVDPTREPLVKEAGLDVIVMDLPTPGSLMIHTERHGGILICGDCAVAPGPSQPPDPPRLERPAVAPEQEADFRQEWTVLRAQRRFASVLPFHGTPYVNRSDMAQISQPLAEGPAVGGAESAGGAAVTTASGVAR